MARQGWRIQAHWRVGDEQKSYQPTYERSRWKARKTSREMAHNLSHFVDLRITVDRVDTAAAAAAESEHVRFVASIKPALLHLFDADHRSALCGAALDLQNILMTIDMMELSSGERCQRCAELAASTPDGEQ